LTVGALNLDGAAVQFHTAFDDDQAQAAAGALADVFAAVECVEDMFLVFGRNPERTLIDLGRGETPLAESVTPETSISCPA